MTIKNINEIIKIFNKALKENKLEQCTFKYLWKKSEKLLIIMKMSQFKCLSFFWRI